MTPTTPPAQSAPATSLVPPVVPDPGLPRFSRGAAVAAVLALLPLVATGVFLLGAAVSSGTWVPDETSGSIMALTAIAAGLAFFVAIVAAVRLGRIPREERPRGRWLAILTVPLSVLSSLWGFMLALILTADFTRGRQLRERGRVVFAPLVERPSEPRWLDGERASAPAPEGVADAWRENGKTEHASVAAFAKLAAELVALGAPARLVEDAHKDALDEIAHARLCFSLARDLDGKRLEPGDLPRSSASRVGFLTGRTRTGALARLAVESLIDGALNEGVSARVVARLAKRVSDTRVRAVLVAIAGDEGRHASHGWDVLAWCVAEGGVVVKHALRGALASLPTRMGASLVADADDGRFEPWGIPGRALLDEVFAELRADVVTRARALVA